MRLLPTLGALLLLAGCGTPPGVLMLIELQTDWEPGVEFDRVELELAGGAQHLSRTPADQSADYRAGVRLLEIMSVPDAEVQIRVRLLDDRATVGARTVVVAPRQDLAVSVLIARSCAGVDCPGEGSDPAATSCHNGQCVDPRCLGDEPFCGESSCVTDADCDSPHECARAYCERGACFAEFVDARCTTGRCTPQGCEGCAPAEGTCDDGLDGDCDGLIDCADPDCEASRCDDGTFCNGEEVCQAGVCATEGVAPCESMCDEAGARCVECMEDLDCGVASVGDWSSCSYSGTCDESASRRRDVTTPTCMDGVCMDVVTEETDGCSRDRSGVSCGGTDRCFGGGCYERCSTRNDGSVTCGELCGWCSGSCRGAMQDEGTTRPLGCGVSGVAQWCHCSF